MATIVSFHAHPDDEAISTGGTLALAARSGHRVIVVAATGGEEGEVPPGWDDARPLGQVRAEELAEAGRILGVHRVELLGYRDSGMVGSAANEHPDCFARADVDEAARRLAELVTDERIDIVTVYDSHGGYGHPDHIQVHRVGHRLAELIEAPFVYEATIDRDHVMTTMARAAAEVADGVRSDVEAPDIDPETFGLPSAEITTRVAVGEVVGLKRAALGAHRSQIPADSFFLSLDEAEFRAALGTEWFVLARAPEGAGDPLAELAGGGR